MPNDCRHFLTIEFQSALGAKCPDTARIWQMPTKKRAIGFIKSMISDYKLSLTPVVKGTVYYLRDDGELEWEADVINDSAFQ